MRNGKYVVSVAVMVLTIAPSVAFASWWNPLSWSLPSLFNTGSKAASVQQTTTPTSAPWTSLFISNPSAPVNSVSSTVAAPEASVVNSVMVPAKKSTSGLAALSNTQIIQKVKPAIVYVAVTEADGSGMIIQSGASYSYVLTNAHVVKGVSTATITLQNGQSSSASVVGRDENADIAILKMPLGNLPSVTLGNSDSLNQGDSVFALGYPFGITGDAVFTNGIVSKTSVTIDGSTYIENTADIHPGNSGGALVDQYGQVVGITTASSGDLVVEGVALGETIKLAIPINAAKALIPQLENGLSITAPVETSTSVQATTPPVASKNTDAQCEQAGQDAYNQSLASATGTSVNDPTVASELSEIQSEEASIQTQHDNSVAQIHSSFDPLIASTQANYSKLQAAQTEMSERDGSAEYSPAIAQGNSAGVQQQEQSAVSQIQSQEQLLISQADATYQSAYSQYEAARQKILAGVQNRQASAQAAAQSMQNAAYASCMAE